MILHDRQGRAIRLRMAARPPKARPRPWTTYANATPLADFRAVSELIRRYTVPMEIVLRPPLILDGAECSVQPIDKP